MRPTRAAAALCCLVALAPGDGFAAEPAAPAAGPIPTTAAPPAPVAPKKDGTPAATASSASELPESLKALARTKKARLAGAWGGYPLRAGGPVLALSVDGRRAASAGPDLPLRLWNLETGRQTRVVPGIQDGVTSAAFSPDGKLLATGGHDGSIVLWDAETGKFGRALKRHQGEVSALSFAPDGKRLASGGEDGTVRVWNLGHGRGLIMSGHADFVRAVAFFADGGQLASASDDGTVRVWDLAKGRVAKVFGAPDGPEALAVAVSPDGAWLLVGREGGAVQLIELSTGEAKPLGQAARVLAVTFAADGGKARAVTTSAREVRPAATAREGTPRLEIKTWSMATCEASPALSEADDGYGAAAFSGDGQRVLVSGGGLTVWDLDSGTSIERTSGHTGRIEALAISPDGRLALSAADDGTARLWEAASGKELFVFTGHARSVRTLAFSPDNGQALIGDAFGLVRIWDLAKLTPVGFIGPHRGVLTLTFAEGAIVSASLERTAVWDRETGKEVYSNWFNRIVSAVSLSRDGRLALAADPSDGPVMREVASGKLLKPLKRPDRVAHSVLLTRDGATAALVTSPLETAGPDALEVWDTAQGKLLRLVRAPLGLRLLAFSEDGKLLLGASGDGSLRMFATKTLRETDRLDLQPNSEQVTAAAFAPDGLSFLVGTSLGGLLHYLIVADPSR